MEDDKPRRVYMRIYDQGDQVGDRELIFEHNRSASCILLFCEGYGDKGSELPDGCPLMIELYDGELRLIVFGDINREDPTHVISLEGARESLRREEPEDKCRTS